MTCRSKSHGCPATSSLTTPSSPSPSSPSGHRLRLALVTAAVLMMTCLVTPASSASLSEFLKHSKSHTARQVNDCDTAMVVSAICYHCASLNSNSFNHAIHTKCCAENGRIREYCADWYTEEPKRGRRDTWYY